MARQHAIKTNPNGLLIVCHRKFRIQDRNRMLSKRNLYRINVVSYILFVVMVVFAGPGMSIGSFKPSPLELRLLPPYCAVRAEEWGNNARDPRVKRWLLVFGDDFIHLHHYCQAILDLRKATQELSDKVKYSLYSHALSEFNYVAKRVSSDFVLWSELLVFRSVVHDGLGHTGRALRDAREAIRRKPGYLKGIINLADLLVRHGKRDEARKVISDALNAKPQSSALKRRMNCLDGDRRSGCPKGY